MTTPSDRRRFLQMTGTAFAIGLAGCFGSDAPGTEASPSPSETATNPSPTQTETPTDDRSGPVLWEESVGAATTRPTVDGDTAYVGTGSGTVDALSTADGHRRWSTDTGTPVVGRPIYGEERVFVVSGETALHSNHRIHAMEATSGDEDWQFAPDEWWLDILGLEDGLLYVGTHDDALSGRGETLYALDVESGDEEWSGEIGDGSGGLVTPETVYVPSYGRLYAYDAVDGTQRWSTSVPDYSFRTIAATPETVCFVTDVDDARGKLVGVDAETGDQVWANGEWIATSTTLQDGVLYVGGQRLAAIDPATGETRWKRENGGFVPRAPVRDGTLYVGGDGLRAHDVADGTERWSWTADPAVEGVIPNDATDRTVFVDTYLDEDPRNRYKFAVNADAGEKRWVFDGETDLTRLTVADERVFVGGEAGSVYALGDD